MDRGKDPFLLPYTYTPSSSTMDLLLPLEYYQECEPIIFKMFVKSKFVLWQPRYYNLMTEKGIRKFTLFNSREYNVVLIFLKTPSLDDILLGKFYIVKFNYFSGRPNKMEERFWNIFDWPLCWWYWKQK